MDVKCSPTLGLPAQDFALKEVVVDSNNPAAGTGTSESDAMLLRGAPTDSDPHKIAVEKRKKGILPGLRLKKLDGSQVENMSEKLKSGPISFSVQSEDQAGNKVPLTVTCELKQPDSGCCLYKGSPSLSVTVKNASGVTVETDAIGGFWVTGENNDENETHCVLDFREQTIKKCGCFSSLTGNGGS